jgi:hypothetical protein
MAFTERCSANHLLLPASLLQQRPRGCPSQNHKTAAMAPKKKDEGPKERPILGRFKNNLKVRLRHVLLTRSSTAAVVLATAVRVEQGCCQASWLIGGLPTSMHTHPEPPLNHAPCSTPAAVDGHCGPAQRGQEHAVQSADQAQCSR